MRHELLKRFASLTAFKIMQSVPHKRKRIESLYVLKAICAYFVVSIHVMRPQEILMFLSGIGTPCFLCITGYLLYSSDRERELNKCTTWAQKSFWLTVVCGIIYSIATYFFHDRNVLTQGLVFHLKNLLLGMQICGYLWYLTALWQALLLLWVIIKYVPRLLNFLPFLFIVAYIFRNYNSEIFLFESITISPTVLRNTCVCTSLPFLATGYLIHKHHERILKQINVHLWFAITLVLAFSEFHIRRASGYTCSHFLLFTYPLIVLSMLLCIKHQSFTLPILGTIGKHHSPNIYYFHGLFIWTLNVVGCPEWNLLVVTACIYCACIPCSYAYNFFSKLWIEHIWLRFKELIATAYTKLKIQTPS